MVVLFLKKIIQKDKVHVIKLLNSKCSSVAYEVNVAYDKM